MRTSLVTLALCLVFFAVYPLQAAHAGAYDDQCKAAGGTALVWDGVGLRWCCIKRTGFTRHKATLWCKS